MKSSKYIRRYLKWFYRLCKGDIKKMSALNKLRKKGLSLGWTPSWKGRKLSLSSDFVKEILKKWAP